MLREALLIATVPLLLAGGGPDRPHKKHEVSMPGDNGREALAVAGNLQNGLSERVAALKRLAAAGDTTVTAGLKELLNRPKPDPNEQGVNWDPAGEERVVDLFTVAALCRLGDNSEIDRIGSLVAAARRKLQGPDDETGNAVEAILLIGQVGPVKQLVALCDSGEPVPLRNAVRTLNRLKLPDPAVGGPVDGIPHLTDTVTFEIHHFREEIEAVERLSHGSIVLSPGTRTFVKDHDYERGEVKREHTTLATIIRQELDLLDLCYFTENDGVTICTYADAGQRWRDWWGKFGKDLAYSSEARGFVLMSGR